jgi:hypothetical protein
MNSREMAMEQVRQENNEAGDFFKNILKNWRFAVVIFSIIGSIIFSWSHFESKLEDLKLQIGDFSGRISIVENSTQAASVNYATLGGKIETVNGKLDIILKHDGLQ